MQNALRIMSLDVYSLITHLHIFNNPIVKRRLVRLIAVPLNGGGIGEYRALALTNSAQRQNKSNLMTFPGRKKDFKGFLILCQDPICSIPHHSP